MGYTTGDNRILNPLNLQANYGPMDYDRLHVFSVSHLWQIPFGMHGNTIMQTLLGGWQLNGILTWQTGTPLTITADPVTCACPGNTVFALRLPAVPMAGAAAVNRPAGAVVGSHASAARAALHASTQT